MSAFKDPFDPALHLGAGCVCGVHRTRDEHDAARAADDDVESLNRRVIESAVMRALFPRDETRRRFIRAVGASTAVLASVLMLPPLKGLFELSMPMSGWLLTGMSGVAAVGISRLLTHLGFSSTAVASSAATWR